jgi:hypothetical protein
MDPSTLSRIRKWFVAFVRSHAEGDGRVEPMLRLKSAHSGRVAKGCRAIAADLEFGDGDARLAEAVGLLHDVARFPQFRKYRTFHDAKSLDHGDFGAGIFDASELKAGLGDRLGGIISDGIRFHNKRAVPGHVAGDRLRFVNLVRDGDKMDIYGVVVETIRTRRYERDPEILMHAAPDGPISPDLVDEIRTQRRASYQHVRSLPDWVLLMLAWTYDINYAPTLRRIERAGHLAFLMDFVGGSPVAAPVLSDIRAHVAKACRADP